MDEVRIVKRKRVKRITLSKTAKGLVLTAPKYTPKYVIEAFLAKNRKWIESHTQKKLDYWGIFSIKYQKGENNFLSIDRDRINFTYNNFDKSFIEYRNNQLKELARNRIKQVAPQYIEKHQKQLNKKINRITYKEIYSRWGSCSNKNNINLSIFLGKLPEDLIEYVVVHELTHLVHQHHQSDFWSKLGELLPDYRKHRKKLKAYSTGI